MRDKVKLTQDLLEQLPSIVVPLHEMIPLIWKNIRGDGGMRLTDMGYDFFVKELKTTTYRINLEPFTVDSRMMLALDRKLNHPSYKTTE